MSFKFVAIANQFMNTQDRSRLRLAKFSAICFTLLLIVGYLSMSLWAQSDKQASDSSKSWTTTVESENAGLNPTRTVQSHTQSDNRTTDTKAIQRRDSDGH